MPFNGSGAYSAPASSWNPATDGTVINSTDWTALLADITTALSTAVLKDGTQTITANLPMNSFKLTGLAAGSAAGNSLRWEQLFTLAAWGAPDGTAGLPAITFAADSDNGRYRIGTNNYADSVAGAKVLEFKDATTAQNAIAITGNTAITANGGGSTGSTLIVTTSSSLGSSDAVRGVQPNDAASACFTAWNQKTSGDNLFVSFMTEGSTGTVRGSIDFNRGGTATRYNTTSDGDLKDVIGPATRQVSLDILRGIQLRNYTWKEDPDKNVQIGPIAQEMQQILAGAVTEARTVDVMEAAVSDIVDAGGQPMKLEPVKVGEQRIPAMVDKTGLVWHQLAGWQEHDERIAALRAEFDAYRAAHP